MLRFRTAALSGLSLFLAACATATPVARTAAPSAALTPIRWPVRTVEHIDLWIHAFALLATDSSPVPLYRKNYRDSMTVIKNRINVLTSLDANRAALAKRLAESPNYLAAQFLPLDLANWDVLRAFIESFLQANGDPRRVDKAVAARVAQLAAIFPAAADREWLRMFVAGVGEEQQRFFVDEQSKVLRARAAVISAADSLWQRVYRPRFERFLANTNQRTGEIVLSIPVGAEGRTGIGRDRQTVVVVPFPDRVADANQVMLVFAHEITGTLVTSVIADNTTPAEQRAGAADRLVATAQVRAGAILLERVAPELLEPYMRLYLAQTGALRESALSGAALRDAFAVRFAVSATIVGALDKQIDIVLGGI